MGKPNRYHRATDARRVLGDSAIAPGLAAITDRGVVVAQANRAKKPTKQPSLIGRPLTEVVYEYKGKLYERPLTGTKERVPPGVPRSGFSGFPTIYHALAEALGATTIPVIVTSGNGLFRVFESNQPRGLAPAGAALRHWSRTAQNSPYYVEQVAHVVTPTGTWTARRAAAKTTSAYVSLLHDFVGLMPNNLSVTSVRAQMNSGVLNFDDSASPTLNGYTFYKGNVPLPSNKTDPLPIPASAITRLAFTTSPAHVMMTVLHELDHFEARSAAVAAHRRWQQSKGPRGPASWLTRTSKRDPRSQERLLRTLELRAAGSSLSETAARIAAFVGCYHVTQLAPNPAQLPAVKRNAPFDQLGNIWRFWPGVTATMKSALLKRFTRYAASLPGQHRSELMAYLSRKQGGSQGRFYAAARAALTP